MNSLGKNLRDKFNMFNKKVMGEEGSTLLLIMLTVSILSILGAAILSMSMMNLSMKKSDMVVAKSKYYSESGIDQVYARLGDVVRSGLDFSKQETDEYMKDEMNKINEIFSYTTGKIVNGQMMIVNDPTAHPQYDEYKDEKGYFDENYNLNQSALKAASEAEYKRIFREYMNVGILKLNGLSRSLKDKLLDPYKPIEGGRSANITIDACLPFEDDGDTAVVSGVKSEFLYDDNTKKVIQTDIVIHDTGKTYPLRTVQEVIKVKDNPIWQNTLVANGDIKLKGSAQLLTRGNVFAMGRKGNNVNDPKSFGGFIADENSNVIVRGNIYSREYVQLAPNSNSNILVELGSIYANTVITQEGSRGGIRVIGDVYTKDDLELDGDGSKIYIEGSYYGFSDGSDSSSSHDNSSAIVINAKTFNSPASAAITIRGNNYNNEPISGTMIWGTSHINGTPSFQMAESVSFKQNAFVYTWKFDEAIADSLISDNFLTQGRYNVFDGSVSDKNESVDKYIRNPSWQTILSGNGATADFASGSTVDSSTSELNDREAYFLAFQEYVDTNNDILTNGKGCVNIYKYIYTTGLRIGDDGSGKFFNVGDSSDPNNMQNLGQAISLRRKINKDYPYLLHYMRKRGNKVATETVNAQQPNVENANPVEKYTKLDTVMSELSFTSINEIPTDTSRVLKNFSATNDVLNIYGAGYSGVSDINNIYLGSAPCEGIILRKGNINIYGNVSFNGSIITDGDITINNGTLGIINYYLDERDKRRMAKMIYKDEQLTELFDVSNYGSNEAMDAIHLEDYSFKDIHISTDSSNINNNNTLDYDRYLSFKHWRVIE